MRVSCLSSSSALKVEEACSETFTFSRLHGSISQVAELSEILFRTRYVGEVEGRIYLLIKYVRICVSAEFPTTAICRPSLLFVLYMLTSLWDLSLLRNLLKL
jgi:hypothetical protein